MTCFPFHVGLLVNQPALSPCATWYENAITFVDGSSVTIPTALFVSLKNTVYVASILQCVFVWREGDVNSSSTLISNPTVAYSVFEASNGEVFGGTGNVTGPHELYKWVVNTSTSTLVTNTRDTCLDLFIDDVNRLYCSMTYNSIITRMALSDSIGTNIVVAGGGTFGSTSNLLSFPAGIFVTTNYTLYVADACNGRIQLFPPGQMNATTVAGAEASGTVALAYPTGVTLDADGYMFIVDQSAHSIVGQGPYGFRCIVGVRKHSVTLLWRCPCASVRLLESVLRILFRV